MGSSVIFSGTDVKTLKSNIDINGAAKILTGTADPSSSATSAPAGSIYMNTTSGILYRKLDAGSSTNWVVLSQESAVNLIGMNSVFQGTNVNDRNAETSVGNWVTYADAAAATPVDMTGGSPAQTTLSRTTTGGEVLNGQASFKVVKAAANAQGEGLSVLTTVPVGYRGQTVALSLVYKVISGSVSAGDLKMFVYDVTNSSLITPTNNSVTGTAGIVAATFPLASTTASIRVGFHFASTSTTAVTFSFDDVAISANISVPSAPRSEVVVRTRNGAGSTNTMYVRYTTVEKNTGSDITYADSSTGGASWTINSDGLYSVYFNMQGNNIQAAGLTLNDIYPTTAFNALPNNAIIICCGLSAGSGLALGGGRTLNCSAGDVIRMHFDGTAAGGNTYQDMVAITKVNN